MVTLFYDNCTSSLTTDAVLLVIDYDQVFAAIFNLEIIFYTFKMLLDLQKRLTMVMKILWVRY